jgi:hypothetical protein
MADNSESEPFLGGEELNGEGELDMPHTLPSSKDRWKRAIKAVTIIIATLSILTIFLLVALFIQSQVGSIGSHYRTGDAAIDLGICVSSIFPLQRHVQMHLNQTLN